MDLNQLLLELTKGLAGIVQSPGNLIMLAVGAGLIYLAVVWFYCLGRDERKGIVRTARQVLVRMGESASLEKVG